MSWLSDMFTGRKQERFCTLLERHSQLLQRAAQALQQYAERGDPALADQVDAIEHEGDDVLDHTISALNDTFITPFDRQDIYNLACAIDDMIDYLNNAAREMKLFNVSTTLAIMDMVKILVQATDEIGAAVLAIERDPAGASLHAVNASKAENRVEDLYRRTVAALFDESDVHAIFKLREIYRHLSNSADRADAVGKLIGKIVVKIA